MLNCISQDLIEKVKAKDIGVFESIQGDGGLDNLDKDRILLLALTNG